MTPIEPSAVSALVELAPGDPYPALRHAPGVAPVTGDERRTHAPDAHLILRNEAGVAVARGSCWWTTAPLLDGARVGAIGHYAAADGTSGERLLACACARLREAGCTLAVGPMDGSTWRGYRLVTATGSEPPFFLEPDPGTHAILPHWQAAGFTTIAEYTSALTRDLAAVDPRVARAARRLEQRGITIRPLGNAERDLRRIFDVARDSFSRNVFYSPIGEEEFLALYRTVLPFVRPELVLVAELQRGAGATACGFAFAVPDLLQARRGQPVDTVVVKSVAVRPSCGADGLGAVLVARVHEAARRLGFRRAIHALMHEQNASRNISRRYAGTMRRYALLGRRLTP